MRAVWPFVVLAAATGIFLPVDGAQAQAIPSPYEYLENKVEAGPFLGVMSAGTGRFGFGPDGGTLTGIRWGIELAGPMSFEAVAGYLLGDRDIVSPGREEGDRVIGTADVRMATIDGRLKFSFIGARAWNGLSPFMTFGGGIAFDMADADPIELDLDPADQFDFGSSFFGTLGLGSRWFVSERFTVRVDGTFSLWRLGTPPGFSDEDRGFVAVEESEWTNGGSLTLAGLWRW